MQRFEVRPTEVALHFYKCARAHCWLLRPEVIVSHGAKGEPVLITARRLVGLWIRTCGDCAESLLCCRPCLLGAQHFGRSEQQAAAATGSAGFKDPGTSGLACGARPAGLRSPAKFIEVCRPGRASRATVLLSSFIDVPGKHMGSARVLPRDYS